MHVTDSRAQFVRGDAMRLPFPDGGRRWRTAASSASSLLLSRPLQRWPASCAPAARSPRTSGTTPREAWNSSATSGNRSLPGRGQSGAGRVPASGRPGGRGGRRDQHRHTLQEFRRLRGPVPGRARACPVVPRFTVAEGGQVLCLVGPAPVTGLTSPSGRRVAGGGRTSAPPDPPAPLLRRHGRLWAVRHGRCVQLRRFNGGPALHGTGGSGCGSDPAAGPCPRVRRKPARQAPTERATPRARQERLMVAEVAGRSRRVPAEPGRAPSSPVRRGASGGT